MPYSHYFRLGLHQKGLDEERNDLRNRVNEMERIDAYDKSKTFVPNGYIDELILGSTVDLILKASGLKRSRRKKLVKFVTDGDDPAKKIFVICVLSKYVASDLGAVLEGFMKANFRDSSLPITDENRQKVPFLHSIDGTSADIFESQQWRFLAPIFEDSKVELDLLPRHPLPFTDIDRYRAEGGYGVVHKVTVHEAHRHHKAFSGHGATNGEAALKEISLPHGDDQVEGEGGHLQETQAHKDIRELNHPHIIEFISTIHMGADQHFLLFPWANGKDLRKYWEEVRKPTLSSDFVQEVVEQCRGLVDALDHLHNLEGGRHYRHTDIKPANILRVVADPTKNKLELGTLKISDMGLAKRHTIATSQRHGTNTRAATTRYRPPETAYQISEGGIGRRYDIWSMGCVMFELIIWLLHGTDTLDLFNNEWLGPRGNDATSYFERLPRNRIEVHSVVIGTINALLQDQECRGETAIGDLLRLVQGRMLVVGLEPNSKRPKSKSSGPNSHSLNVPLQDIYTTVSGVRATAKEVSEELVRISRDHIGENYFFTGQNRDNVPSLKDPRPEAYGASRSSDSGRHEVPTVVIESYGQNLVSAPHSILAGIHESRAVWSSADVSQNAQLNYRWDFSVDNKFAVKVLQSHDKRYLFPQNQKARLCGKCRNLNLTAPSFQVTDTWQELETRRTHCDFCNMRWDLCKDVDLKTASGFEFQRDGSNLRLDGRDPPVLAICRGFDRGGPDDHRVQMGFPRIPPISSPTSFKLLRTWLQNCDDNHPHCQVPHGGTLPTRLLDVGTLKHPALRLHETQKGDAMKYIALSHPWGEGPHYCTLRSNIDQFKKSIGWRALPATFQHAVHVSRELGLRYIWIDSLCIIQGSGGDFEQEAGKMESIFSSAYCVLSACSARGQSDGFLKLRKRERDFLTFERQGLAPLYICRFVDDFSRDVLDSNLSHRGWVLQERALARRTIYFTDTQAYWECGECVRCQSLTKMNNKLSSFLGDPNFPSKISGDQSLRGEQILFYEDLYRLYSRLRFTRMTDRPVAIAGLQSRLVRSLYVRGGFGVFDDGYSLLQHSLLWKRGTEFATLTKIDFGGDRVIPSWSWMAYNEGIDFLDLPLGDVEWLPHEIISPWADAPAVDGSSAWPSEDVSKSPLAIRVRAREFLVDEALGVSGEHETFYDVERSARTQNAETLCVLMGRVKDRSKLARQLVHCVLFVEPRGPRSARGEQPYERVGVGFLAGRFIDLDSPGALVRLK